MSLYKGNEIVKRHKMKELKNTETYQPGKYVFFISD